MTTVKKRNQHGFSMMEGLFAIFLAAISAIIFAAALPAANSSRSRADMLNKAVGIAQKQMEAMKAAGYTRLNGPDLYEIGLLDSPSPGGNGMMPFTNVDTNAYDSPSQVLPQGKGYVGIEQVALDLRSLIIRMEWTDRGNDRNIVIASFVANL